MKFRRGRWWSTAKPSKISSQVPELLCFSLNINVMNRFSKRSQLSTMRKLHNWGILLLSDTRIHDEREFSKIDYSLGCKDSVWSLGTPHVGGTAILLFQQVIVLAKYSDPHRHFCRIDVMWEGARNYPMSASMLLRIHPKGRSFLRRPLKNTLINILFRRNFSLLGILTLLKIQV
jgi:hypothetical protein